MYVEWSLGSSQRISRFQKAQETEIHIPVVLGRFKLHCEGCLRLLILSSRIEIGRKRLKILRINAGGVSRL